MPFVAVCLHLRHLQLSHMLPAPSHGMAQRPAAAYASACLLRSYGMRAATASAQHIQLLSASPVRSASLPTGPHSSSLLAHVAHLVRLTQLDLACSQTRAWRGQAVQVTAEDLAHLTGCTALQVRQQLSPYLRPSVNWRALPAASRQQAWHVLTITCAALPLSQVLDLSHQPCLQHPASLAPLAGLCCLTALCLSISDTSWVPPADAWQALAALTGLQHLDLSGWSRCRVTQAAAATGGHAPGEEAASPNCSCVCQQTAAGPERQQQQQQGRSRRSSDSSTSSSGGSASSSSGGAGSSRIGRALGRLLHGRHHAPALVRCTCSAAVAPVAGSLPSTPAAGTQAGCEAARIGATHSAECAAPLQLLSSLTRLQQLLLAHWAEPPCLAGTQGRGDGDGLLHRHCCAISDMCAWLSQPHHRETWPMAQKDRLLSTVYYPVVRSCMYCCCFCFCGRRLHHMCLVSRHAGLFALQHLPHLSSLDISRCMNQLLQAPSSSAASSQQVSLLALLTGTTKQQQQLATAVWPAGTTDSAAHAQPAAAAPAGPAPPAAPAVATAAALSAAVFDGLLCLKCSGVQFVFEPVVWTGLSHLRCLDVSACPRFKAKGCGSHLKELQQFVASGELASLLLGCCTLFDQQAGPCTLCPAALCRAVPCRAMYRSALRPSQLLSCCMLC